jgi:protein-S-isoprenylcysteine O-methyltransferase Ste14
MASWRKLLLILPSSFIFFLLIPVTSVLVGRSLDNVLRFDKLTITILTNAISLVLILFGGYYVIESIRILLDKGKGVPLGDFLPEDQSTELITTGIYAQTRNPMVFGYFLCLISLGLILGSISTTVIIPTAYLVIWTIWLKAHEEPALEARFGEPYKTYKEKTPYLVPRPWRK